MCGARGLTVRERLPVAFPHDGEVPQGVRVVPFCVRHPSVYAHAVQVHDAGRDNLVGASLQQSSAASGSRAPMPAVRGDCDTQQPRL